MPAKPPNDMPRITPNLFYDDIGAAIEWLAKAFGFETKMSLTGEDGAITHAEMFVEDSLVMMSPAADHASWQAPKSRGGSVSQSLYVYVDDVDAHCDRARSAGATIDSEPEDMFWGDRTYVALDPEGHRWTFAQFVRDVDPSEM